MLGTGLAMVIAVDRKGLQGCRPGEGAAAPVDVDQKDLYPEVQNKLHCVPANAVHQAIVARDGHVAERRGERDQDDCGRHRGLAEEADSPTCYTCGKQSEQRHGGEHDREYCSTGANSSSTL